MKKNYKDYPFRDFGYSDIASLVIVCFDNDEYEMTCSFLNLGSDGNYRGRVVYNDVDIPSHYTKQKVINASWLKLYDDSELVFYSSKEAIYEIYTAGERTILINIKETK